MNIQYAIKDDELFIIEVNPRASRDSSFVSKAIGISLAKLAARVMAGEKLKDLTLLKKSFLRTMRLKNRYFLSTVSQVHRLCLAQKCEYRRSYGY